MLEMYRDNGNPTLGEVAKQYLNMSGHDAFVGTATKVADTLEWLFREGQIDGFQFSPQWYAPDYYRDIVDVLVPELQRRGLTRTKYRGGTLRDMLAQDTPE
jgi:alkanesulfonate monooxygenase SsuD/methylene tetrahydromethanopterin reductase-like flavin-dependent oxidoreductase (luciferase family)